MSRLSRWFAEDFTLSKQMLGFACVLGGILAGIGILLYDVLRSEGSFGPFQRLGLIVAVGMVVVGLSLLPLGDTPA